MITELLEQQYTLPCGGCRELLILRYPMKDDARTLSIRAFRKAAQKKHGWLVNTEGETVTAYCPKCRGKHE